MSDFVIRKDIYGSWWHDFNNDATKINISDFEALIDDVQNTFIIQCKNGSNVPTMGVSIANVKVINSIISPTPIAFSGAVGLKNLLTTLNYTPYVTSGGGGGSNTLQEVLTEGNNADNTIELENSTNITTIEQGSIHTKNKASTAGVSFSEQGIDIYTQNESLAVGIRTDNITETYFAQLPNKIGGAEETFAMVSDIPTIPTAAIDRGTFSGEFALSNAVRGGEYTPLTQTGALTLSIGAGAVNGGIDTVLLTANGSAISGFSTWKKLSSDSISTTAATVMFIMVRQYQGVIYYTVNIIT